MKKIVTGLLLLAAIGGYAQAKPINLNKVSTPREKMSGKKLYKVTPDEQAKELAKQLNLDDKQQAKVKALYEEKEKSRAALAPELKKMENGEQHDHAAMKKKMKEDNTAFETKLKGILSKEQYTTWQESKKKSHGKQESEKLDPETKS